jgi:hypothetical protein
MKNILYIILLVCVTQLQAQKTFKIINLTANTISIPEMVTANTTISGYYPQYSSKRSGVFSIAPFGTFTMQNTSPPVNLLRFPYVCFPVSTPTLGLWVRTNSSIALPINISAAAAGVASGNTQAFHWVQITNNGTTKTIGISGSGYPQTLTSNGWTASYTLSGIAPVQTYTITVQ